MRSWCMMVLVLGGHGTMRSWLPELGCCACCQLSTALQCRAGAAWFVVLWHHAQGCGCAQISALDNLSLGRPQQRTPRKAYKAEVHQSHPAPPHCLPRSELTAWPPQQYFTSIGNINRPQSTQLSYRQARSVQHMSFSPPRRLPGSWRSAA